MTELWDNSNQAQAMADGWQLIDTIDSGKRKVYLNPYPYGPKHKDSFTIMQYIVDSAQRGSPFHTRALQCIARSRSK